MRLLFIALLAAPALSAQTYVSSAGFDDATGATFSSVSAAFSGVFAAGNLAVCYLSYGESGNTSLAVALSGTGGDSFVQAGVNAAVNANNRGGLYYKSGASGGASYTVTATFSASGYASYVSLACAQYSGVAATSAFDAAAQGTMLNAPPGVYPYNFCTTGALTTASAHELLVLGARGGTPFAAPGLTVRVVSPLGQSALADVNLSSVQTGLTATMSGGSFNLWNCNAAAFRVASSARTASLGFIF